MDQKEYRQGLQGVVVAMLIWGLMPIYWKALIPISSWMIILYRLFLVCVTALALARTRYSFREIFAPFRDRRKALLYFLIGFEVALNWSLFIYAVNSGQILQTSLGYYIEPVVICLAGVVFFREKWTPYNGTAVGLAGLGILILLLHFGQIPTLALLIAFTFALYSAFKKSVTEPPLISLTCETLCLAPLALVATIVLEVMGRGALGVGDGSQYLLLLLSGALTVLPLGIFAFSAQRISMFALGLAEYIAPTMTMLLGVFVYHEPIDRIQVLAFVLIWVGLAVFSLGEYRKLRRKGEEAPKEAS